MEDPFTLEYEATPESVLAFRLVVATGTNPGAVFDVPSDAARVIVGSAEGATIVLSDRRVSRRHAALVPARDRIELEDLGSSNGTWVNGVQVRECALRGGELLRLGDTTLRVETLGTRDLGEPAARPSFGRVLGVSRAMRTLFTQCARLAATNLPLLIEGETGTGKELLAEAIHEAGPRRERPFVVFDPALAGSEAAAVTLFGAARGATPQGEEQVGLFERADGGTLLIDGPEAMPLDLQRRLLRAVEKGEVQRVGSDRVVRVDVRLITLAVVDVERAVEDGRLREDLVHRLFRVRLSVPPLRKRTEDVGPLMAHFWRTLGGGDAPLPPELGARYEGYAWPGNVRELENVVARAAILGASPDSAPATLAPIAPAAMIELPFVQARQRAIAEFEGEYVRRLLEKHGGNVGRAASASGLAHRYFQLLKARHRR
jgi:DNA-binding NtrC family response regulator